LDDIIQFIITEGMLETKVLPPAKSVV